MTIGARGRATTAIVGAGLLLAVLPMISDRTYVLTLGYQLLLWTTLAVSWNLFSGFANYPSFGHGMFFGIGVYATSTVLTATSLPYVMAFVASGVMAGGVAVLLGLLLFRSPRFRGDLFGLVTLVLAFVVATVVSNTNLLDGGTGVFVRAAAEGTVLDNSPPRLYLAVLAVATLTVVLAYRIASGRWGLGLTAIRDDEEVAEASGVNTYKFKVLTFGLSAGLAGLVGSPHAVFLGYVEVGSVFPLSIPLFVLMMAILGGTTTWYGPIIGAVLVTAAQQALIGQGQAEVSQIIIGMLLVVLILLWPTGLGGLLRHRAPKEATP
jgi:branched-chain amino acid transport system permease protein